MKCLLKYKWVKLPRDYPYMGKGIMAHWVKLASRAAFRKGNATYCGHSNPVQPGMWSGGIVGVKSILGLQSRGKALETLDTLTELGYFGQADQKADLPNHRLGCKVFRSGMLDWCGLRHTGIWVSLPSSQYHRTTG